jgi:GH25 family lysozyme M1 (1,4-beta-N-acetylmuramidase)
MGLLAITFFAIIPAASAQDQPKGPPDAAAARRLRIKEVRQPPSGPFAAVTALQTWALNPSSYPGSSPGTYGIDLSHWETDDCSVNWQALPGFGLRFVYLETSTGVTSKSTVVTAWNQLESLNSSKTLFRGAYHFLYPNFLVINGSTPSDIDASKQAGTFLQSIGANGQKQAQLPPIVDIEWTRTKVDAAGWAQCPSGSRQTDSSGQYCDMWYQMTPQNITKFVQDWISRVEGVTQQKAIIYTNASWWSDRLGSAGADLLKNRAVWISVYTSGAPKYDSSWTGKGGNPTLGMPPLPNRVAYPSPYNIPDFWQFSATGTLSGPDPFSCHDPNNDPRGALDFSFIPVTGAQFETVFGIQ